MILFMRSWKNAKNKSMKQFIILLTAIAFAACNEQGADNTAASTGNMPHMHSDAAVKPDFSNVQFASKRDTICRMPLSAGISDTAIVGGKTYGFCSKECKAAFLQQANQ